MFKNLIILSLIVVSTSGFLFSQSTLKFTDKVQKFNKVNEGTEVKLFYPFTNTSEKPIIINDAKVSCSCTLVEFPTNPIDPGLGGEIEITFNTTGKIGFQERTVEIITNSGSEKIIFKGVVKASTETKIKYKENH